MPLTTIQVRNAQTRDKDYKLADEKGLFLLVKTNGSKYWRLKYRYGGKEKLLALGVYGPDADDVSLADARNAREIARTQLARGVDPNVDKRKKKIATRLSVATTFEGIARDWIAVRRTKWSERHTSDVTSSLEKDIFPDIGTLPIDSIDALMLRQVLDKVQKRGALEIAARLRQRCSAVFCHAIALGLCANDPAAPLKTVLMSPPKHHLPALSQSEFPMFLRQMVVAPGKPLTVLAMRLIALTFVRTSELIGARWEEIDLDQNVWDIPPERMKKSRPHYVPLARQAVSALQELYALTGQGELLFPKWGSPGSKETMSNGTILRCIDRLGYRNRMTGHGFRSVASTTLNESGLFGFDAIERQLAHEENNAVRAAYNRASYMEERRKMMQWWADHLDSLTQDADVIILNRTSTNQA